MTAVGAFMCSSRCTHAAVRVNTIQNIITHHVVTSNQPLSRDRTRCVATWSAVDGGTAIPDNSLRQSKDSWQLYFNDSSGKQSLPAQRVLLVDGTNLACLCAGGRNKKRSPFSSKVEDRFASWLTFLQRYTSSHTVLVAFDNKGSVTTNVRAQLLPGYLRKRYTAAAGGGGGELHGWAHLGAVVRQINQQQQQQQQQSCFLVANAAYGYEADDVLAAAAEWIRDHLTPHPVVVIASSDSDMQQLMTEHTYWLELLQVPTQQHPSGLKLHSSASFQAAHSFPAVHYADYLSLVGKPDTGVLGVGVSDKVARKLIQKFGTVDDVIEVGRQGQLVQFGTAAAKLSSSSSSSSSSSGSGSSSSSEGSSLNAQQKLLLNKRILQHYSQQQMKQIPQQQMMDCFAAAAERQQQQQQPSDTDAGSSAAMAAAHPSVSTHMSHVAEYLSQISHCLHKLEIKHKVGWLTAGGLWCDIIIHVHGSHGGSSSSSAIELQQQQQQQQQQSDPEDIIADDWLVVMLLSPADLSSKMDIPITLNHNNHSAIDSDTGNNDNAVDFLAHHLGERCGSFVQGNSSLGHARRKLLDHTTGSVKRRVSLLKGAGWKVAVVPFYELHLAAAGGGGGSAYIQTDTAAAAAAGNSGCGTSSLVFDYMLAVMAEQCGPAWKPPVHQPLVSSSSRSTSSSSSCQGRPADH